MERIEMNTGETSSEVIVDWSGEDDDAVTQRLKGILDTRSSFGVEDWEEPGDTLKSLEDAVRKFPTALRGALMQANETLEEAGVASYEVYIAGGFAREAEGSGSDFGTGLDRSIRSDTDIDVIVMCTPQEGRTINTSVIPSPFFEITSRWRNSELGNIVEFDFGVSGRTGKHKEQQPKILLWKHSVSS